MNCISVRCGIVFEMCCLEYVNNREGVECDLWLNSRTSDVMCWVLKWCELCPSWALLYLYCCYNYIIVIFTSYMYAFVYLYSLRNVMTHSVCVVCVWILWWSWTMGSWEQMARWITLRNLVLEDAETQCSNRMWHWSKGFCFHFILFQTSYFIS